MTQAQAQKSSNELLNESIIHIMDTAFEDIKKIVSTICIEDSLTETDLDQLAKYRELLKLKDLSDSLLK